MRRPTAIVGAAVLATAVSALLVPATAAHAVDADQSLVVSGTAASWTPQVLDGRINAVAAVGNDIVIGGTFTQVQDSVTTYTRSYIAAFDATTGVVDPSFNPTLGGVTGDEILNGHGVDTLATNGLNVLVGGVFSSVNGVTQRGITELTLGGARVAAFAADLNGTNKQVGAIVVNGGKVYVGGKFDKVNGVARSSLAVLNAASGAVLPFNVPVTGQPARRRSACSGQPGRLAGRHDPGRRGQLHVGGRRTPHAAGDDRRRGRQGDELADDRLHHPLRRRCQRRAPARHLTGRRLRRRRHRWRRRGTDAVRLGIAVGARSHRLRPAADLVRTTGGDTLTLVATTGTAVYIAGHQRWVNNFFGYQHERPELCRPVDDRRARPGHRSPAVLEPGCRSHRHGAVRPAGHTGGPVGRGRHHRQAVRHRAPATGVLPGGGWHDGVRRSSRRPSRATCSPRPRRTRLFKRSYNGAVFGAASAIPVARLRGLGLGHRRVHAVRLRLLRHLRRRPAQGVVRREDGGRAERRQHVLEHEPAAGGRGWLTPT